jgi:tripartite-type tricarboxylate transporter receptor subunit TctC
MTAIRFAVAAFALIATPALAQEWPSGTVKIVVPYAAGGPVDVPARLLIDRLTAQTKGVFILENRPGAGGSIGLQSVMQSPPDGSTFLSPLRPWRWCRRSIPSSTSTRCAT